MTMISVKGLSSVEEHSIKMDPLISIRDNLPWLKRNIDIMELGLIQWDEMNIDDSTLCVILYEGLAKAKAFIDEIEKAVEKPDVSNQ